MPHHGASSLTSLVRAYALSGQVAEAERFAGKGKMPTKDAVSHTVMLTALAQVGHLREAEQMFESLQDPTTAAWNAFAAAYAHNGHVDEARAVFERTPGADSASWNAIISAYSRAGHVVQAFELLRLMQLEGIRPVDVTYTAAIAACRHAGLLEDDRDVFRAMVQDFGIPPLGEHYSCLVDLLGRSGRVDVNTASRVAYVVLQLGSTGPGTYSLLSNMLSTRL